MKNKLYEEFAKEKFSKEKNYNAIISKVKGGTAMKKNKMKIILNIAAIFIFAIIVFSITPVIYAKIQWNIEFKEYQNREYEIVSGTFKEAKESGYNEEIEMDYITQDGISAKVDTLMITDDYFETKINFKFPNDMELNSETFSYGIAVYDEEKNIYGVFTRMNMGSVEKKDTYTPYMYEEIGAKYNKNDIYDIQLNDSSTIQNVSAENKNIISKFIMTSNKGFPKSKKIYIRVFDLGYYMSDLNQTNAQEYLFEDFVLSDAEWIFEIDVPEKFYERQEVELELKEDLPELKIEEITVNEIGLVIKAKRDGLGNIIKLGTTSIEEWSKFKDELINITDEAGNVYYGDVGGIAQGSDWFKMRYDINKNMLDKKLFLNIKIDEQQHSIELVKTTK